MRVELNNREPHVVAEGLWQWDFGQTLQITGLSLPPVVEVHFSLTSTGMSPTSVIRLGTGRSGMIEVDIPDAMLENRGTVVDYTIYAFVYVADEQQGKTVYCIDLPVKVRPKPGNVEVPKAQKEDLFRRAVGAVSETAAEAEAAADTATRMAGHASQSESFVRQLAAKATEASEEAEQWARKAQSAAASAAEVTAKAVQVEGGVKVTVTDKNGTTTATLTNGKDGAPGADYVLTDGDKTEIAGMAFNEVKADMDNRTGLALHTDGLLYLFVDGQPIGYGVALPSGGAAGDIVGNVDSENNIVLFGSLAAGTYTVKYETEDGTIAIGELVLDTTVYHSVASHLTSCVSSNSATSVKSGESYTANLTANDGYELSSVVVTMGGVDISSTAVSGGVISVADVTGDLVITAVATELPSAKNFCVPGGDGWIEGGRCSSDGADRTNGTAGWNLSNYMAVQNGDVVYVKNADLCTLATHYCGMYGADKTAIGGFMMNNGAGYVKDVDLSGEVETFTIDNANAGYIRVVLKPHTTNADIVINIKRGGAWLTE